MEKKKAVQVKVTDKTPTADPKGGGHHHGQPSHPVQHGPTHKPQGGGGHKPN